VCYHLLFEGSPKVAQLYCILVEPRNGRILLRSREGGWELPRCTVREPGSADTWDTNAIRAIVTENLGVDAHPIYAMEVTASDEPALLAAFGLSGDETQPGTGWQWVSPHAVGSHLADAFELSLVDGHLASQKVCVGSGIVPWLRTGWLPEAETWIRDQLDARGVALRSRPEPVTSRFVGRTLQMETSIGRVYFKAISHVWCREVAITLELSAWQPRYIPAPLAADPGRGWMLTTEVQGPTLAEVADLDVWEKAVRVYAGLQKASIPPIASGSWKSLFDWRPEALPAGIDRFMAELEWLQAGYDDPLSESEADVLRRGAPQFRDMCLRVAGSGVPAALEHQDLHPGNVRIADGTPVYLDWAWSSVTHPFLSLSIFVPPERLPSALPSAHKRLLSAYFEEWQDYGTAADLEALSRLVHAWSVVQYAVTDAEWMRSYLEKLPRGPFPRNSYLAWILRMRQYYWVKCLRRMLRLIGSC
jgi:hypothetical protein